MAMKIIQSFPVPAGIENLIGQRFHNVIVKSYAGKNKHGQHMWNYICDCGKEKTARKSELKDGRIKSCGDLKNCSFAFTISSLAHAIHGLSNTPEFGHWNRMMQRCYNPNDISYDDYGKQGITVYEPWHDVVVFKDYLDNDPRMPETREQFEARTGKRVTLDRIDTNKNYEPGNIRWATYHEQAQNQTSNVFNKQLVKFVKWEYNHGKYNAQIFKILKTDYNYQGGYETIRQAIIGKSWSNITIDKELAEYQQFGTINGIAIVNDIVIPDNF